MSTNQISDETLTTLLQALEIVSSLATAAGQCTRRFEDEIDEETLKKATVEDINALREAAKALRDGSKEANTALKEVTELLKSFREGIDMDTAALEFLETCKKASELVRQGKKAEGVVQESLANIQNKAAEAERENEDDQLLRLIQRLEAIQDELRGILRQLMREIIADVRRQMGEMTAGVRQLIGNVKKFLYGGKTGDEENPTDKEAGGWRAQMWKHKPALEAVTVEKQGRERELGEQIWVFEGVKVDYDEDPECGKMYRELEDKLEPPKGEKPDEGTGTGDCQRVSL